MPTRPVAVAIAQVQDNLADELVAVGVNLLDTCIFSDRDRTANSVVRVARGLWERWGPRMQSILEQTVKALHEVDARPSTEEHEQYTIVAALLTLGRARARGPGARSEMCRAPFRGSTWVGAQAGSEAASIVTLVEQVRHPPPGSVGQQLALAQWAVLRPRVLPGQP